MANQNVLFLLMWLYFNRLKALICNSHACFTITNYDMRSYILISSSLFFALTQSVIAQSTPTISGPTAFWYLGGILQDGGGCALNTSPCYYATASLTANANGHAGTPTWSVTTVSGSGNAYLSCSTCTGTLATSTQASSTCSYDLTIYITYPDGAQSANFNIVIAQPSYLSLVSGFPQDSAAGANGYQSLYSWLLYDTCGYTDYALDDNENFGTWINDYAGNSWGNPTPGSTYQPSAYQYDYMGAGGQVTPPSTNPQTPLGSTKVKHASWTYKVGTQTFGSGIAVA
jgi:hypothetical protein